MNRGHLLRAARSGKLWVKLAHYTTDGDNVATETQEWRRVYLQAEQPTWVGLSYEDACEAYRLWMAGQVALCGEKQTMLKSSDFRGKGGGISLGKLWIGDFKAYEFEIR